jgi:ribose transport system permease protein
MSVSAMDAAPHADLRPRPPSSERLAALLVDYGVLLSLGVLFVVLSFASDAFLSKDNLVNLVEANSDIGIVACAGTLVIVAGGLDVSVGAIYALAGVVSAKVAIDTSSVPLGVVAGVGAGAALGVFNGLVVTLGRVNSFVATLAGGIMFQSAAQVVTGANLLTPEGSQFTALARGGALGLTWIIWFFFAAAALTGVLLARARFGRHVAVVGANAAAARLSGVPLGRVRCMTFALSGLAAGVAGVVTTSQSGQGDANVGGTTFVLSVVAAIAVGGTSLRGGEGAVWRTVMGVLFLGLVTNGLHLLNVDPVYDQLCVGLLILLAVGVQALGRRLS